MNDWITSPPSGPSCAWPNSRVSPRRRASCRLPKSLVTKRVNYLEQHLGTPLLARTTRRVRLTESGSLYHPRALALVEELEALEQSLGEAHVQLRGLVRVSCPTSFGVRYLGPALSGFLCAHPNLTAEILLNDRVVNPAEEGYDLVLTDHPMISGQFQEEPMCDLALVACAAPAYLERTGVPVEPATLREHDVIHYAHNATGHDWRFDGAGRHQHARHRASAPDHQQTAASCAARRSTATASRSCRASWSRTTSPPARCAKSCPAGAHRWRGLKAVLPRRREVVPKTRLLVAHLRERFAALGLVALPQR